MINLFRLVSIPLVLLIISCGKQTITPNNEMQNELNYILNETFKQAAIATNVSGNTLSSSIVTSAANTTSCKPSFKFSLSGVSLVFQENSTCFIYGTIDLTIFPLAATFNIESTKLKFIKSLKAEAKVSLSGGNLSFQFLDGRIQLRNIINLPWQDLVMNGKVQTVWQNSSLNWRVRANAFESSTKVGLAVLNKETGIGLKACFLSNADPMNPDAGNISACLGK